MEKMKRLDFQRRSLSEMEARSVEFLEQVRSRRSVREFSTDPIPLDAVRAAIEAAGQAPSGANKQPWTFILVTNPEIRRAIREAAEAEERKFYGGRASQEWLDDLSHLGTDTNKPFLEIAPALIVVFMQIRPQEGNHYYVKESVGLATGFLLAALHHLGLGTLTHTPSPMAFLSQILGRPETERPFLLIPVGFPSEDCQVPHITRKKLSEILVEI